MRKIIALAWALTMAALSAAPVTTLTYQSGSSAESRSVATSAWSSFHDALLVSGFPVIGENFESGPWLTGGNAYAEGGVSQGPDVESRWYSNTLVTGFGAWTVDGLSGLGNSSRTPETVVLKSSNSPFAGRLNTTPGGAYWLDSNDVTSVVFTPSTPVFALGFLISDATDQGASFNISFRGGTQVAFEAAGSIDPRLADGTLAFFSIVSNPGDPITSIRIFNSGRNTQADGFGMDDFIALQVDGGRMLGVPEPGSFALTAAAMATLLCLARKRRL